KTITNVLVGEHTLRYTPAPSSGVSVFVWGGSVMDTTASFYRVDGGPYPSLQKLSAAPTAGKRYFLNILTTGVDTSDLWGVKSVEFKTLADGDCEQSLELPTTSPRRSTYIRLGDNCVVPELPFSVVYEARDSKGNKMVRRTPHIFQRVTSLVKFDDTRGIPWLSGETVVVTFTVTNIGDKPDHFDLTTGDIMGVIVSSPKSVTVDNGKSETLSLELTFLPRFHLKTNFMNITRTLFYPTPAPDPYYHHYNRHTTTPAPVLKKEVVKTDLEAVTNIVFVTATSSAGVSSTAFTYIHALKFPNDENGQTN
ncbi:hypothetical protein FHG87_020404, partial [Trinorchestia longiramus]